MKKTEPRVIQFLKASFEIMVARRKSKLTRCLLSLVYCLLLPILLLVFLVTRKSSKSKKEEDTTPSEYIYPMF